jgi:hypothetical protein
VNSASVRALLVRGMLAGLAAGVLALLVSYFLGEPLVDEAISIEEAASAAHAADGHGPAGHHGDESAPPVSRALQATAGLGTGVLLYGAALGGIAALVLCFALGRTGRFGPRATAALVAGGAFVTVYLVPFLKYPANPPAVGDPATAGDRAALHLLMTLLGLLLAAGAVLLGRRLAPRLGNWNASVAGGTAFVLAVALAYALLPSVSEVPEGFPAALVWEFRLASLAVQATLWTGTGLALGHLAERQLSAPPASASVPAAA